MSRATSGSAAAPRQPAGRAVSGICIALAIAAAIQCGGSKDGDPDPASLAGVPLTANSVAGGNSVSGNVTLTGGAPGGGATVSLSSSNTGVATVPPTVTVPSGAASAGYTVATSAVGSDTPVTITGSYGGATQTANLTITAAPTTVVARFDYTPDTGTSPPAGQCSITRTTSGSLMNVLRCRFDAGTSTPNPGITEYRWQFPGASGTTTGAVVTNPQVPCGTFSGATSRDVMLTVTAPQGSNSTTKTITFVKVSEC